MSNVIRNIAVAILAPIAGVILFALLAGCGIEPELAIDVSPTAEATTGQESPVPTVCDAQLAGCEAALAGCEAALAGCDDGECIDAPATIDEAVMLLESQGYFVAKDVEVLDRPVGFPEEDEFPLEPHEWSEKDGGAVQEACKVITKREAPEEWYKPIYAYCRWRIMNSSRAWQLGKQVESKIDGTPTHDRDRSSGHYFYDIAVATGRMNPKVCPHHRLPSLHVEHPPECIHLAQNYEERFKVPLDPVRKTNWLKATHAAEQFTAYGPADWNAYHGYKAIGGCYPFTAFDRTDVAVTAIVRRSAKICAKYGCANTNSTKYIKPHWNESI